MALKGSKITHWRPREQRLLFTLGKAGQLTWEEIAAKISKLGAKRTAASCAQFFKVRLDHLKRFPKTGVMRSISAEHPQRLVKMRNPVQTTVKYDSHAPGPVLLIIDGHVTRIEKTSRTPAELLTFLLTEKKTTKKTGSRLAAARSEENDHGTSNGSSGVGEPSAEHP